MRVGYNPCPLCGGEKGKRSRQCDTCRYSVAVGFWPKVDRSGGDDACWPWMGRRDHHGYGRASFMGELLAHRVAFRALGGTIPTGLELDHVCRNRICVNPKHLDPVTHQENHRRRALFMVPKSMCVHGHSMTPENTYVAGKARRCRTCLREQRQRVRSAA